MCICLQRSGGEKLRLVYNNIRLFYKHNAYNHNEVENCHRPEPSKYYLLKNIIIT